MLILAKIELYASLTISEIKTLSSVWLPKQLSFNNTVGRPTDLSEQDKIP